MFLCLLFFASNVDSSESFLDTLNIKRYISEGVVVTASRYKDNVSDISSSVSIITEEDIRFVNSYTAPDLLSGVPGVEIMKTGNFGRADVVIRGIGNNGRKLGFLIDGRPEKMSIYDCAVTHTFPLHNVKRIEVVKGPLSSLYGSGAMGGVVNILTKKSGGENELDFGADYGSFNTHSVTGSFKESFSKLDFLGTVQENSSDGHLPNSASATEGYQGEIVYNISEEWKIDNYCRYVDTYNEIPATLGDTSTPTGYQNYERGSFDVSVYGKINNIDVETKLFRTFGYHDFSDGWESRDRTDGISPSAVFSVLPGNKTQTGIEFYKQYGKRISAPGGEWDRKVYEGFFHTEQKTSLVNFSAGFRYTYPGNSDGIFSYDGGVVFKVYDTRLRARIGKGFRLPSFSDLYLFPTSNDSLAPEELWDYEIGVMQKLFNIADFDVSLYRMNTDNFIRFSSLSRKMENIDTLVESGLETSVGIYPSDWIYFKIFYSYIDRRERTQGVPGQKWSGNVTFKGKILEGRLSGSYLTDYYAADNYSDVIPSYYVFDFRLNFKPKDYLSVSLGIDNVLDKEYSRYVEIPGATGLYRMPGRTFKIGVALRK
jgi:outer membrane cobalamin receptor